MLDRDVLVPQALRVLLGGVQQPCEPLGDEDLAGRGPGPGAPRPPGHLGVHGRTQRRRVGAGLFEQAGHESVPLVQQGEQQMLAVGLVLAEPHGDGLGVLEGFLRLLGEPVHVHRCWSLLAPLRRSAVSRRLIRSRRSTTTPSDA